MNAGQDHISVCVCTYKRQKLLANLLAELQDQTSNQLFTYSIVVVDNDNLQSAKSTVEYFKQKSLIPIHYYNEPEQNIALARNKAVESATGNFIAFIDDDEFPEKDWLLHLYQAYKNSDADGIFGPVKPYFQEKAPDWLIKGKICERLTHKTGTILSAGSCRTGNVLLHRNIFHGEVDRFDRAFGRTGGEDNNFFHKKIQEGRVFKWCNEAVVHEIVPPERWKKSYYLKRYVRMGGIYGSLQKKGTLKAYGYSMKFFIALMCYTLILPFSFLFGQHVSMRILMKAAYNFAWLSAFCGHVIVKYKDE